MDAIWSDSLGATTNDRFNLWMKESKETKGDVVPDSCFRSGLQKSFDKLLTELKHRDNGPWKVAGLARCMRANFEEVKLSSKGGAYRLNFPFFHLVKEMYGEKVGQKRMDNEFKMATVDGWKLKV